jgi:transcriptional regulator with PAS, ATPase and Fis domain
LVCGETGTGKELVAHVLHNLSPAAAGPFVVCNAAAIVDTLFESELFGHIRGAFTGAGQDKRGLFEAANGGTLFLDEIAELPLAMQAKLLRVLQNREVLRVGSTQVKKVNVRVIAASNRDLRQMALLEQFRQDLYYRLAAVEIKLPRLSEREGDVLVLIRHFLRAFSSAYGKPCLTLTRPAQALLTQHTWPGNVRELENTLDYACMMAKRDVIDVDDLPDWLLDSRRAGSGDSKLISMEEVRINHARQVLNVVNGNRARAAEILGISRATLYRLVADVNASDRN